MGLTNSYALRLTNTSSITYQKTESTSPTQIAALTCPTGFVPVPGSATYGTSDFCVMKYEAKNVGGVATSQATGVPWASINQIAAASAATAACAGCVLISESQWMTIAQNVLSNKNNWSGGYVGSGYIYSGHNDNSPASSLEADNNDANGYYGETNSGGNQKRTLTLSNGQIIWDFAGNMWEWTSGQMTAGQPNGCTTWAFFDWKNLTGGNFLYSVGASPYPKDTAFSNANNWTAADNGIGQVYCNISDLSLHGFLRGGTWNNNSLAGVMALALNTAPSNTSNVIGFRASK